MSDKVIDAHDKFPQTPAHKIVTDAVREQAEWDSLSRDEQIARLEQKFSRPTKAD